MSTFGKFLSIFASMVAVSIVVAIFGVLFFGFNGSDVMLSYAKCFPFLTVAYSALSLACLAMTK
jgi:hypothetical protein